MAEQMIKCPHCGKAFPVSRALTSQVEAKLRAGFEEEAKQQEKRIRREAEAEASAELKRHLKKKDRDIARAEQQAADRIEQEYHSRELEYEKKLRDAKRQAAELKRQLEQGSQQLRGEVIELELEQLLAQAFPEDDIEPIGKGRAGGDVLQKVRGPSGQHCGSILWESKNDKKWQKAWLGKLRNDQRRVKADLAVLVSAARPKDGSRFTQMEGVWVTELPLAVGVGTALRTNLVQVAGMKRLSSGKSDKMAVLYEYLCSTEFRHRVEAIVEGFRTMQDDLNREREAVERQWAKREKQLHLVLQNVSGMYGEMQEIAGPALPRIRRLEQASVEAAS